MIRNDAWLLHRLNHLWDNHFSDVTQDNPVFISFGRHSRLRLGSIRLERHTKKTYIVITGMFKHLSVPEEVVDHTIAHELCHYVHGFSSLKPRLHKFPHHGGVVNRELKQRGLDYLLEAYKDWLKDYRKSIR